MKNLIERIVQLSADKAKPIETERLEKLKAFNPYNLFIYWFNTFPSCIDLGSDVDIHKAAEHIVLQYSNEVKDVLLKSYKEEGITDIVIRLYDDTIIVLIDTYEIIFKIYYRTTPYERVSKLAQEISNFKRKSDFIPQIGLIHRSGNKMNMTGFDIKIPKLNVDDNYNDDFLPIHKTIVNRLQKKDDKGLVLLHGKPGTGKTSYLRYLIGQLDKNVIFLPPDMATLITEPGLIELLIDNKNSIFVIEDAENILIDRNQSGSSAVSALLNLTDGLLSDCLNIQIICTFNTDLSKLDKALLRKGRLIAKYEFNELNVAKAQALSDKLGFNSKIDKPMTLTDIYNQNEESFASQATTRKQVGFNVAI